MSNTRLIIFILIFLLLGFVFYKIKRYEFTDNSKFILNLLFNELGHINDKLKYGQISEYERKVLSIRENEIYYILEQFFGKDLKEQKNELV